MDAQPAVVVHQHIVEALQPDRLQLADGGHRVGGGEHVLEAQQQHRPRWRQVDQLQGGAEDRHARALGPHQRLGHVEALLRQQRVEVVAAHPPRELWVPGPHGIPVAVAERPKAGVDLAAAPALRHDRVQLVIRGPAHRGAQAVVGEHVELFDVVRRPRPVPVELGEDRMYPARVVAEHPAERAAVVGGRVGAERQTVGGGRGAKRVQHHPGLDPSQPVFGVHPHHAVQVLREVHDHRDVARLPGQARPPASAEDGDGALATGRHRGDHVVGRTWHHHPDRHLPVVGCVARVDRPRTPVEPHLALQGPPQLVGQVGHQRGIEPCRIRRSEVRTWERHGEFEPYPVGSRPRSARVW